VVLEEVVHGAAGAVTFMATVALATRRAIPPVDVARRRRTGDAQGVVRAAHRTQGRFPERRQPSSTRVSPGSQLLGGYR